MIPRVALPVLVAVTALSGCSYDLCIDATRLQQETGSTSDPIIGGKVDDTNRSVVALVISNPSGSQAICSGTVIAKRGRIGWVLTAAHCVQGSVDHIYEATDWRDCTSLGDPKGCRASYEPRSWVAHPDYDPEQGHVNDFGLVAFIGADDDTAVTPVVSGADDLISGSGLLLSGFGRTYAGEDDPSVFQTERHSVPVAVTTATDHFLRVDASTGKTACFGDSGGPAFAKVDGKVRVVGVASTADALCEVRATYGRLSSVYASFIAPNIVESPESVDGTGGGASSVSVGGGSNAGGSDGGSGGGATGDGGSSEGGASGTGGSSSDGGSSGDGGSDGVGGDGGSSDVDDPAALDCVPATLSCSTPGTVHVPAPAGVPLAFGALALGVLARRRRAR